MNFYEEGLKYCKNQDWPRWRIDRRNRNQHILCDSEEEGSVGSESDTEETAAAAAELNCLRTRKCLEVAPPHAAGVRRRWVSILAREGDEATETCEVREEKRHEEEQRVYGGKICCARVEAPLASVGIRLHCILAFALYLKILKKNIVKKCIPWIFFD